MSQSKSDLIKKIAQIIESSFGNLNSYAEEERYIIYRERMASLIKMLEILLINELGSDHKVLLSALETLVSATHQITQRQIISSKPCNCSDCKKRKIAEYDTFNQSVEGSAEWEDDSEHKDISNQSILAKSVLDEKTSQPLTTNKDKTENKS